MISLCEAFVANPTGNQPPNPTVPPVNQQQTPSVPTQNLPVGNEPTSNPAASQQSNTTVQQPNNGQSSFDWKKILKPLAIGGAAIGTIGLAHAMYNGNLPHLGSGASFFGAGDDDSTPAQDKTTSQNNSDENIPRQKGTAPRNTNYSDIHATPGSTMVGPPPQEHIPQRPVYREARPMFRNPQVGTMYNSGTGDYYNFRYNPRRYDYYYGRGYYGW